MSLHNPLGGYTVPASIFKCSWMPCDAIGTPILLLYGMHMTEHTSAVVATLVQSKNKTVPKVKNNGLGLVIQGQWDGLFN